MAASGRLAAPRRAARQRSAGLTAVAKFCEKIVGDFLGGAVDQALAELRQLAADLRIDVVGRAACRRPSA